ncbi:MAG: response regulator [Bryobacteraceae bacterium]
MINLLVVDDNPAETYLMVYAFEKFGSAVTFHHAKDGKEALEALSQKTFDLMILDLNLPGLSGYDVLEQCPSSILPVVVFSLSSNEEDARRALALGAREFVHKPAVLDTYRETVVKMVERWVPEAAAASR